MTQPLRILVVGAGSPNADMVAEVLRANSNSLQAEWTDKIRFPNPISMRRFDLVYGIYLQTCYRYIIVAKLLGKRTVVHFVGSDAYWLVRERSLSRRCLWKIVLYLTDLVFYVSSHLQDLVRKEGLILPFPIAATDFQSPALREIQPERDVLYYCPGGEQNARIYRLSWITEYARNHSDERVTIIGNIAHPADYDVKLPNVEVVPFVEATLMPRFYRKHRKLIRMTTEDGLPRMIHEALLCGLQVVFNGEEIGTVPKGRDPEEFTRSFLRAVSERWPKKQT